MPRNITLIFTCFINLPTCICVAECCIEVEAELMTESGDSIKIYRSAAQLTQTVTPAKHPPTGLKLIRGVNMYNVVTQCFTNKVTLMWDFQEGLYTG